MPSPATRRTRRSRTTKRSIDVGKLADVAILDKDACAVEPRAIRDIKVERTIIRGESVFEI